MKPTLERFSNSIYFRSSAILYGSIGLFLLAATWILYGLFNIKIYLLWSSRFGQQVLDLETEELRCGGLPNYLKNALLISDKPANTFITKIHKRRYHIIVSDIIYKGIKFYKVKLGDRIGWINEVPHHYIKGHPGNTYVQNKTLNRFEDSEITEGRLLQTKLGVAENSKIIAFYTRHDQYFNKYHRRLKLDYHSFRNTDISILARALEKVVSPSKIGIRIGKHHPPLGKLSPYIIDYASSTLYSDFGEAFLLAYCDLFVGTSSGPIGLAFSFNRNILQVDTTPMSSCPLGTNSFMLPRIHLLKAKNKRLSLIELIQPEYFNLHTNQQFIGAGIDLVNNEAWQIEEAIRDVCGYIEERLNSVTSLEIPLNTEYPNKKLWIKVPNSINTWYPEFLSGLV